MNKLRQRFAASLFLLVLSLPGHVLAETRVAFVVGNSTYENAPTLSNPARDARLVADTLRRLDFEVTRHQDLTRDGFSDALGAFLRRHRDADVTFFYFAGHGMQYEGQNYLVGTDAELRSELDIDSETIELAKVVDLLERNSKAALVFVDACRDNPLASDFYRRNFSETRALETRGLARMRSRSDGSMLVFAAAPGQVAYDGDGVNSPFAKALARHLPTEGAEILSLTKRIIGDVREATDGRQSPIVTNDLTQEIFLREAALRPNPTVSNDAFDAEQEVFDAAQRLGTLHAWSAYFSKYPHGRLYSLAISAEHNVILREASYLAADWKKPAPVEEISDDLAARFQRRLSLDRDDIVAVQALMKREGFYKGPIDGDAGQGTRDAIRALQRDRELPVTGITTRATAKALGLNLRGLTDFPAFSSHRISRVDIASAKLLGLDSRLIAFVEESGTWSSYIYGYFGDHLYVASRPLDANRYHPRLTKTWRGLYPVSIGSAEENRFVYELVRYEKSMWFVGNGDGWVHGPMIGLFQSINGREPASGWEFAGDSSSRFRNWGRYQPDNFKGSQDYSRIWMPDSALKQTPDLPRGATWDDTNYFGGSIVLEHE